jgi:DNA invertase Pin-like site-specific DNA recombinase
MAAMNEFERLLLRERVRAGLRNAKAKGILPGRKISAKGPEPNNAVAT